MAGIGGLPNLGNRRLTILQKQLNSTRKSITIVNDKLKESLERLEKSVDKTKASDSFRSWQKTIPVKKSMMEMQALKKCLRARRESTSLEELGEGGGSMPRNGVYGGASLHSMRPDVDTLIAEKAPAMRRMRKVQQMKSIGYRDGLLCDYDDAMDKLSLLLTRPKVKHRRPPLMLYPRKVVMRREMPLGDLTYRRAPSASSASSSCEPDDLGSESEDVVSDLDATRPPRSASADGIRGASRGRGGLYLPPIRAAPAKPRRQSNFGPRSVPERGPAGPPPGFSRRVSSLW